MAKRPSGRGKDDTVGLFDSGPQARAIARMLERATEKAVNASLRQQRFQGVANARQQLFTPPRRKKLATALAGTLSQALSLRHSGKAAAGRSLKLRAADGGRTFHFKYYSISKGDPGLKPLSGGGNHATQHHRYIERELAVEAIFEPGGRGADGPSAEQGAKRVVTRRAKAATRDGMEIDPTQDISAGNAREGQSYIEKGAERPTRLKNGEIVLSSFGNIGESFEERIEFWDLLYGHESRGDSRLQNRIIVELPHESTPEIRRKVLEEFMKPYAKWGLRYHVAIHAPGKKNDERNYHAHIVYSERPADKIIHPETGKEVWDFAVTRSYKTSSRNTKTSHPFRQKRVRELRNIHFVEKERKRYAGIVNREMKRHNPKVKFDPRSYKKMGIDAAPLASINRILGDKLKAGTAVVLDPAWTQRLIAAEIARMVEEGEKDALKLLELDKQGEALEAAYPSRGAMNRLLPASLKLAPAHTLTRSALKTLLKRRLAHHKDLLENKIIRHAERIVFETVRNATNPGKIARLTKDAIRTTKNLPTGATPPDLDNVTFLHQAAQEELAALDERERRDNARRQTFVQTFTQAWNRYARPEASDAITVSVASAGTRPQTPARVMPIAPAAPQEAPSPAKHPFGHLSADPDERPLAGLKGLPGSSVHPFAVPGLSEQPSSILGQTRLTVNPLTDLDPGPRHDEPERSSSIPRLPLLQEIGSGQPRRANGLLDKISAKMESFYHPELRGGDFVTALKETLRRFTVADRAKQKAYQSWVDQIGVKPPTPPAPQPVEPQPTSVEPQANTETTQAPQPKSEPAPAPQPKPGMFAHVLRAPGEKPPASSREDSPDHNQRNRADPVLPLAPARAEPLPPATQTSSLPDRQETAQGASRVEPVFPAVPQSPGARRQRPANHRIVPEPELATPPERPAPQTPPQESSTKGPVERQSESPAPQSPVAPPEPQRPFWQRPTGRPANHRVIPEPIQPCREASVATVQSRSGPDPLRPVQPATAEASKPPKRQEHPGRENRTTGSEPGSQRGVRQNTIPSPPTAPPPPQDKHEAKRGENPDATQADEISEDAKKKAARRKALLARRRNGKGGKGGPGMG